MRPGLVACLVLAGCNQIFGLDEVVLADVDRTQPFGCMNGWRHRAPLEVHNDTRAALTDWQVLLTLDTWTLIQEGKLQPSGADLRFTLADGTELPYFIDRWLGTSVTEVFVKLPDVPAGTSRLWMWYGNPDAEPRSSAAATFVPGILANPSFETDGGWQIPNPADADDLAYPVRGWASEGESALEMNVTRDAAVLEKDSRIQQAVNFPPGANYVIRFDTNITAASIAGQNGNGGACLALTSIESYLFDLCTVASGNITGEHLGLETRSITPGYTYLGIDVILALGPDPGAYLQATLDNLRIRKHVLPEPLATAGAEESTCPP